MSDVEIKPIHDGMSFMKYLEEIFDENAKGFSELLCRNKLNIETERTITFELEDMFGNHKELEITLKDLD